MASCSELQLTVSTWRDAMGAAHHPQWSKPEKKMDRPLSCLWPNLRSSRSAPGGLQNRQQRCVQEKIGTYLKEDVQSNPLLLENFHLIIIIPFSLPNTFFSVKL